MLGCDLRMYQIYLGIVKVLAHQKVCEKDNTTDNQDISKDKEVAFEGNFTFQYV